MRTHGDDGKRLSVKQFYGSLRYLVKQSDHLGKGTPVGVLTSDNRDNWFKAHELLKQGNEETLEAIERALFTLCLDPDTSSVPALDDMSRGAAQSIHGFGVEHCSGNRWFDKCIQVCPKKLQPFISQ